MQNSFKTQSNIRVDGKDYQFFDLNKLPDPKQVARLPVTLKILLENLLRLEDGRSVRAVDIENLLNRATDKEISFMPSRVLLQDFTGVPCVVDLAAMRDAMQALGGDPKQINPLQPVELVIDHSVQVDEFGATKHLPDGKQISAFDANAMLEFQRNKERYAFLRWGQEALSNFKVVPPDTGIVHQVNLEYLARGIFAGEHQGAACLYPDTLVGTDSHTTMINGLGVLGWGVGGIEAEAAMLGQAASMLVPEVIGFEFTGRLKEGTTATDLVLTVTQMLRAKGVVGKFVEFYGDGLGNLPLADRATIANMAPEYGATCGFFPIDEETLRYLQLSGRSAHQIAVVKTYAKAQGMFREQGATPAEYTDTLKLDLGTVEPSIAGPKRPQDRIVLTQSKPMFEEALAAALKTTGVAASTGEGMQHGAVVIAAITSCTNTSNPAVMVGAGLVAKKAVELGLKTPAWVKTSLAPGSRVVTDYLDKAGLTTYLDQLGFQLVGYGCTTCIGNSGPLPPAVSEEINRKNLHVCAVLSGNRNFEGRIHPEVRMNYLASPPLVVAYALAGKMNIDLYNEPLGVGKSGQPVFMRDIWPTEAEIQQTISQCIQSGMFQSSYEDVFAGDARWQGLDVPTGDLFKWSNDSTYVKNPPYFDGMTATPATIQDIQGARVLAFLGDSVTTDHISPAGSIKVDSPAGRYLIEKGVAKADFNSYGARRGNHEVMMRGTFANIRLRNALADGVEGGVTKLQPSGELMPIYDAAMRYQAANIPQIVLAGKEYGSGSSRDWAAKGPRLMGVRAVIAESYERIHRSNLVGMGVLPLQFAVGQTAASIGLTGKELFDITGLGDGSAKTVTVVATPPNGKPIEFIATVRIDTPQEVEYYRHGGILQYVLRKKLEG